METAVAQAQGQSAGMQPGMVDALVIRAGGAGLYELYQLRRDGLKVAAVDTASDVGSTWYWNCYPATKFHSENYICQYLFDEDADGAGPRPNRRNRSDPPVGSAAPRHLSGMPGRASSPPPGAHGSCRMMTAFAVACCHPFVRGTAPAFSASGGDI